MAIIASVVFYIALSGIVLILIAVMAWVATELFKLSTSKRKKTPKSVDDKSGSKLLTAESYETWEKYLSISEEFRTFTGLYEALAALDKRAELSGHIDKSRMYKGGRYRLSHTTYCRHTPAYKRPVSVTREKITNTCEACDAHTEYANAVVRLFRADRNRIRAIEEDKKRSDIGEVEDRIGLYSDLVERMKSEADIINSVTNQVYN